MMDDEIIPAPQQTPKRMGVYDPLLLWAESHPEMTITIRRARRRYVGQDTRVYVATLEGLPVKVTGSDPRTAVRLLWDAIDRHLNVFREGGD